MIRYLMRDFDVRKQQYIVLAVHNTGLALEIGIGLADPLKDIIKTLNEAALQLEVGGANSFYRGQLNDSGKEKMGQVAGNASKENSKEQTPKEEGKAA